MLGSLRLLDLVLSRMVLLPFLRRAWALRTAKRVRAFPGQFGLVMSEFGIHSTFPRRLRSSEACAGVQPPLLSFKKPVVSLLIPSKTIFPIHRNSRNPTVPITVIRTKVRSREIFELTSFVQDPSPGHSGYRSDKTLNKLKYRYPIHGKKYWANKVR